MDPHRGLLRALADEDAVVESSRSVPWASVTFEGARHQITLRCAGAAADRLCEGLSEREFTIPGHLVADIAASREDQAGGAALLTIEALTIASC